MESVGQTINPSGPSPIMDRLAKHRGDQRVTDVALTKLQQSKTSKQGSKNYAQRAAIEKLTDEELADQQYEQTTRITYMEVDPCTPTSARSVHLERSIDDFQRGYKRLMTGIIAANNVRGELRLQDRYEKPKYMRQRLRSARHRRRFAREVALKVAAVMRAKNQGM